MIRPLLVLLVVTVGPAAARAQPDFGDGQPDPGPQQQPQPLAYEGKEVFRWLLHRADIRPFTEPELRQMTNRPDFSDAMVIVLGSSRFGFAGAHQTQFWVQRAARHGGAVLIATNSSEPLGLDASFHVPSSMFTGFHVLGPPAARFDGRSDSVIVQPVPPGGRSGPAWQLFGGDRVLRRVVARQPTTLAVHPEARELLPALARMPADSRYRFGEARILREESAFVVGGAGLHPDTHRPYRVLAVGDAHVFSNGLMVSTDDGGPTDNLEFAERVVSFLAEEDGERRRTKCLLIVDGQTVTNFDELTRLLRPPPPPIKLPPFDQLQPKIVDFGNQILDKIQENDVPNKLMVGQNPDEPGSRLRYLFAGLAVAAAVWAVVSLVRRVWKARQPTDLAPPPPGGRPPPPTDGAPGVFGRRGKELAARDNLLEPARAACREFFDAIEAPDGGPRLPKVVISDVVRRTDTLRQALRDLWTVAYGRPAPVTAMRWAALEPLLARALAAHRDGKWRFVEPEPRADYSTRPRGEA
jgi:hypothetical protein